MNKKDLPLFAQQPGVIDLGKLRRDNEAAEEDAPEMPESFFDFIGLLRKYFPFEGATELGMGFKQDMPNYFGLRICCQMFLKALEDALMLASTPELRASGAVDETGAPRYDMTLRDQVERRFGKKESEVSTSNEEGSNNSK